MTALQLVAQPLQPAPRLAVRTFTGRDLARRLPALTEFVTAAPRVALGRHPGWLTVFGEGLGHIPYALEAARGVQTALKLLDDPAGSIART